MKKYESNRTSTRPDSQYSINGKKKSFLHHVPSFFAKAFCSDTPKGSLSFKHHEPDLVFNNKKYDTNIVKSSSKLVKSPYYKVEKVEKKDKDKENKIIKTKKFPKKKEKEEIKVDEKKSPSNKVKTIEQIIPLKSLTNQLKREESKKINSLVTQYQQKDLVVNKVTAPLKLQSINKKLQYPYYISTLINAFSSSQQTQLSELAKAHLLTSLQLLQYTKKVSKPHFMKPSIKLPKSTKNTIVFDLDQTLIHCNQGNDTKPCDIALDIQFPNGDLAKARINIRPYARQCLQELSKHFQIIIFTASHSCYANSVINHLDPHNKYISHRYFRQSCYRTPEGMYIKDLKIIDRPMNNMLLVDNVSFSQHSQAAYSYCFQIENGIPIVPFYDNKNDTELKALTNYLKMFALSLNMKSEHCKILKTDKYARYTDPKTLITQLYSEYLH